MILDVLLLGFVCIAIAADVLLGQDGRERLHLRLTKLWDKFDDISIPNLGFAEVSYCISVLDRWLSPKFFSIRRIVACVLLNALFVSVFYVWVRLYRATRGLSYAYNIYYSFDVQLLYCVGYRIHVNRIV
jgi:hypothetical protein